MNQGPRCVVLMKKNGGGKSHATVPLNGGDQSWITQLTGDAQLVWPAQIHLFETSPGKVQL